MILGLTSFTGGGKGTVADYLHKNYGFTVFSLSDILRENLKEKGIPETKIALSKEGEELRAAEGSAVLASRTLKKLRPGVNYVIDSIRVPDEVLKLKERPDFRLIAIHTCAETRFRRILGRNSPADPKTVDDLKALDNRQADNPAPGGMKIEKCLALADCVISNESDDFGLLYRSIDLLLKDLGFIRQ